MRLTILPKWQRFRLYVTKYSWLLDALGGGNRIRTYGTDYSVQHLSRVPLSTAQPYLQITISKTASKLNCIKNSLPVFLQFSMSFSTCTSCYLRITQSAWHSLEFLVFYVGPKVRIELTSYHPQWFILAIKLQGPSIYSNLHSTIPYNCQSSVAYGIFFRFLWRPFPSIWIWVSYRIRTGISVIHSHRLSAN